MLGLDWRSVFLVNVPVGVAAIVAAQRLVPESRSESARRLDLGGVALGSLVLGLVVFPLVEGREGRVALVGARGVRRLCRRQRSGFAMSAT